MRTKIIHEGVNYKGQRFKVIAFYRNGDVFFYTRTFIYDSEGYVEEDIRVFTDGTICKNNEEV